MSMTPEQQKRRIFWTVWKPPTGRWEYQWRGRIVQCIRQQVYDSVRPVAETLEAYDADERLLVAIVDSAANVRPVTSASEVLPTHR